MVKCKFYLYFLHLKLKYMIVKKKRKNKNMFDWNPYLVRDYALTRTNTDKKKK